MVAITATNGNTNCVVADVLKFTSGADRLGFEKTPKVEFVPQFGFVRKFATASTCDITLRLPTCHGESYNLEYDHVIDGFGGL